VRSYVADLHIHSCLSPCGSLRMSPRAIVDAAVESGVDLIALTDHNTCAMGPIVAHTAEKAGLAFMYGIELQTSEEVHLLAYFDDGEACRALSEEVYAHLPDVKNDPRYFGDQVVVDEQENIVRTEEKLLLNSITLSLEERPWRSQLWRSGEQQYRTNAERGQYSAPRTHTNLNRSADEQPSLPWNGQAWRKSFSLLDEWAEDRSDLKNLRRL